MSETRRTPVFARYEIFETLGEGGFGTVYKARHKILGRLVALKVLPPALRGEAESMERFKREAAALAQLDHPHVVRVYDADVEQSFPYLAMELVEGRDLRVVLSGQRRLPVEAAIRLGVEIADALDHVHREGIVHRDVKPSNVIIDPRGAARLTDFGIAFAASLPRISRGMLGTPEYMSPEQVDGREIDGRSDLYSLGVVLYEGLTGTVPFPREGDSLTALNALVRRILEDTATPVKVQRAEVPAWLSDVVERCLAKKPADRFPDGAALAAALRAGLSAAAALPAAPAARDERRKKTAAVPPSTRREPAKPSRPGKALWAGLLAVVLVLGSLGYGYTAGWFSGAAPLPDSLLTTLPDTADAEPLEDDLLILEADSLLAAGDYEDDDTLSAPEVDPKPGAGTPSSKPPPPARTSTADLLVQAATAYRARRYQDALPLYQEAAQRGAPEAQAALGAMYANGQGVAQNDAEAARWYRRAAQQGYAAAQFSLGLMYRQGRGLTQSDAEAAGWYRRAAEQGHAEAQTNLAWMYENGRGLSRSEEEAARWYGQAARQGYAAAQYNLGLMYRQGRGVEKSNEDAFRWYLKAAEQGHANAQFNVGRLYFRGDGTKRNDAEAARWYRKAAEQGHEQAIQALRRMNGN